MNYYNEHDPQAAAWLEELIKQEHIPWGAVDTRSIEDVEPVDLEGFTQCHFFAGIGGWSLALSLAGWPTDRPVWTGSCPCQPFSTAGKGGGFDDERHLWPSFFWLIQQCKPATVFGEQVAGTAGASWFDLVSTDLEGEGYACGAANLAAASVGAPHIRQRLYWVGHSQGSNRGLPMLKRRPQPDRVELIRASETLELEDAQLPPKARLGQYGGTRLRQQKAERLAGSSGGTGWWRNADWLYCTDQKYRPVEPGAFPLAHGVPARVGRLRGYGNAIVPQVAAAFIEATLTEGG